jgi:elongation factor P
LEDVAKFLKENSKVSALVWDNDDGEKIIKITLPIKMEFKVTEAPPAVRGDTSKAGNKIITLENGTTISTPMFIKEGDTVRVNTETGEYVERV